MTTPRAIQHPPTAISALLPPGKPIRARSGPKSKLSDLTRDRICWYLQRGHYRQDAAALSGIHRDTLLGWETRGREARSKRDEGLELSAEDASYLQLLEEVEFSLDYGEGWLAEQFLIAAVNPRSMLWQAFATFLERRHRERWRRPSQLELHSAPTDGPVEVKLSFALNPALLDELKVK